MRLSLLKEIMMSVGQCRTGGFGYVKSLMDVLKQHRSELNIGMGCVSWKLKFKGKEYRWSYFLVQKISLNAFNLDSIMEHDGLLNSEKQDLKPFKNTSEFDLAHTVLIPVHYPETEELLFDISGVIILIATPKLNIDDDELQLIYSHINSKSPSTIDNINISKAINVLVSDNINISKLSLKHRHKTLNKALEIMSYNSNAEDKFCGLLHFSFWSLDNYGRVFASKEFNKNTKGELRHDDTVIFLDGGNHYIYHYASFLMQNDNLEKPIEELVDVYSYDDIKDSIKDISYFESIGFGKDNGVVVVVPIKFESYTSVCCFYVSDIVYSPFFSITLLQELSDAIKQRITLVNEINIKNMLSMMMDRETIIRNHKQYYSDVVDILKEGNEADDCLIYLRNEANDQYLLVTEEDETNSSTLKRPNVVAGDIRFYLPEKYASDHSFLVYIKKIIPTKSQEFLYVHNSPIVKTACLTIIKDARNEYYGFILLFNRKHEITSKGTYFNNTFYFNNIYITKACGKYLALYRNLEFSNYRRNILLKKYRHEMPHCTEVIDKNIRIIKENYKRPSFRIQELENYANELMVNCDRIDMLASFFSAIDYDENRLLMNPHPFNIKEFLNTKIDTFREEALWRGVYVREDIGIDTPTQSVSIFYQLSLTNIIINAIRYAAPGTCVWIKSNSDVIEISDIGIAVLDSDRERIFNEGYRGPNARQVDQRGMGYGLYLTKKIIDAHGQKIEVNSTFESPRNHYAEASLYDTLSGMERETAEAYIYKEKENSEIQQASMLYLQMQQGFKQIRVEHRDYINRSKKNVERWIDYMNNYSPFFLDLDDQIFNKQIYHVSFIIHLR